MQSIWSTCIQTTEELYDSRDMRFTDQNKDLWLSAIGAQPDTDILEIGCGGGVFLHKLRAYLPGVRLTGVDRDAGHIAFARARSEERTLPCEFVEADATRLPFADESFDLCYSYTVAEHIPHAPFLAEQRRVLRKGGRLTVLTVFPRLAVHTAFPYPASEEEKRLMEKAFSASEDVSSQYNVGAYLVKEQEFPKELAEAGFTDISVSVFTAVEYAPDSADTPRELAEKQILARKRAALAPLKKALNQCPEALTTTEKETLVSLINQRFERRLSDLRKGIKHWDYSSTTAISFQARKPRQK